MKGIYLGPLGPASYRGSWVENGLRQIERWINTVTPFRGATSARDGADGIVPQPLAGQQTYFLCADGTWKAVSGGGGGVTDGNKGDITVSGGGGTWVVNANAITYAKIQDVSATDKILGRASAGAGDIEEITCTSFARSILDDTTAAAVRATIGAGTGNGDVVGPGSATDNALARFDGATGKLIQNGTATLDDNGSLALIGSISGQEHIVITNTNGGTAGGSIVHFHDGGSPANGDTCGNEIFRSRNNATSIIDYAWIEGRAQNVAAGAEAGEFRFNAYVNGVPTTLFKWSGNGFDIGATGVGTSGQVLTSNGAGALPSFQTVSGGSFTAATQAEQEAASSTTVGVTPGRQQFHPSASKCWGRVTVSGGTPTLQANYNITSITDTNVGRLTVTIATDFSSANYAVIGTVGRALSGVTNTECAVNTTTGLAVGAFELIDEAGLNGNDSDPGEWYFAAFGDQ